MFGYLLGTDKPPMDIRDYNAGDAELYEEIGMHMIENGIFPESEGLEPWFLCSSLSDEDIAETLEKFEDAVRAVKQ